MIREKKISFVLLHYQDIETTQQSVKYLNDLSGSERISVIIVDNASPNKSGESLKEEYMDNDNIHVILNTTNDGFAKGNNIGYIYAKEKIKANTIVVMNNDINIKDLNFLKKLNEIAQDTTFHILAPDILTLDEKHQNPMRLVKVDNIKLVYTYIYNTLMKILYSIPIVGSMVLKMNRFRPRLSKNCRDKHEEIQYNIVPHGSCVIYLENWIMQEEFAFIPSTFMFGEEDILYEYIASKNYKILYNPDLRVTHLEDKSTSKVLTNELKKEKFKAKHVSNSARVLLNMRLKNMWKKYS